ncbi:hypothetical protein B0H12DRAFT_1130164 [Mycena haematopus]|nr:hypothetical protein B0H12DRAFT_1130164 [Mycena haematopus]
MEEYKSRPTHKSSLRLSPTKSNDLPPQPCRTLTLRTAPLSRPRHFPSSMMPPPTQKQRSALPPLVVPPTASLSARATSRWTTP